jgi:hypothetical protein
MKGEEGLKGLRKGEKAIKAGGGRKGVKDEERKDSKAGWWYHLSSVFVCVVYQVRGCCGTHHL